MTDGYRSYDNETFYNARCPPDAGYVSCDVAPYKIKDEVPSDCQSQRNGDSVGTGRTISRIVPKLSTTYRH